MLHLVMVKIKDVILNVLLRLPGILLIFVWFIINSSLIGQVCMLMQVMRDNQWKACLITMAPVILMIPWKNLKDFYLKLIPLFLALTDLVFNWTFWYLDYGNTMESILRENSGHLFAIHLIIALPLVHLLNFKKPLVSFSLLVSVGLLKNPNTWSSIDMLSAAVLVGVCIFHNLSLIQNYVTTIHISYLNVPISLSALRLPYLDDLLLNTIALQFVVYWSLKLVFTTMLLHFNMYLEDLEIQRYLVAILHIAGPDRVKDTYMWPDRQTKPSEEHVRLFALLDYVCYYTCVILSMLAEVSVDKNKSRGYNFILGVVFVVIFHTYFDTKREHELVAIMLSFFRFFFTAALNICAQTEPMLMEISASHNKNNSSKHIRVFGLLMLFSIIQFYALYSMYRHALIAITFVTFTCAIMPVNLIRVLVMYVLHVCDTTSNEPWESLDDVVHYTECAFQVLDVILDVFLACITLIYIITKEPLLYLQVCFMITLLYLCKTEWQHQREKWGYLTYRRKRTREIKI